MKKIIAIFVLSTALFSCAGDKEKKVDDAAVPTDAPTVKAVEPAVEMPYTATYSSNFTQDVPEAEVKTVLDSYKYWASGDVDALGNLMGDTATIEGADGSTMHLSNADLKKFWKLHRDSLSSVKVNMEAWTKIRSDKGDNIVLTWYKEYDAYKTGKVDSATYHDINVVKNGKIVVYSTYKKPLK
jgi:ketosteroid isomerase-like protein